MAKKAKSGLYSGVPMEFKKVNGETKLVKKSNTFISDAERKALNAFVDVKGYKRRKPIRGNRKPY